MKFGIDLDDLSVHENGVVRLLGLSRAMGWDVRRIVDGPRAPAQPAFTTIRMAQQDSRVIL